MLITEERQGEVLVIKICKIGWSRVIMDKLKEECGVFGFFNNNTQKFKTAEIIYFGLFALQHRGQESAGIAVHDKEIIKCHKGMGLLPNVFDERAITNLEGDCRHRTC